MDTLLSSADLTACWNHAQIRHIAAPFLTGYPVDPAALRHTIQCLSKTQLQILAQSLCLNFAALGGRMINKKAVARQAGMTVSWLDNSDCEKAQKLRACGIHYGKSQASPVRYPLLRVLQICREDEALTP